MRSTCSVLISYREKIVSCRLGCGGQPQRGGISVAKQLICRIKSPRGATNRSTIVSPRGGLVVLLSFFSRHAAPSELPAAPQLATHDSRKAAPALGSRGVPQRKTRRFAPRSTCAYHCAESPRLVKTCKSILYRITQGRSCLQHSSTFDRCHVWPWSLLPW